MQHFPDILSGYERKLFSMGSNPGGHICFFLEFNLKHEYLISITQNITTLYIFATRNNLCWIS